VIARIRRSQSGCGVARGRAFSLILHYQKIARRVSAVSGDDYPSGGCGRAGNCGQTPRAGVGRERWIGQLVDTRDRAGAESTATKFES